MKFTEEDLKKVKDYTYKKDSDEKDGYCILGIASKEGVKILEEPIYKEKQDLDIYLMERKSEELK